MYPLICPTQKPVGSFPALYGLPTPLLLPWEACSGCSGGSGDDPVGYTLPARWARELAAGAASFGEYSPHSNVLGQSLLKMCREGLSRCIELRIGMRSQSITH